MSDQSHYNHPGIAITASSGDNGYGVATGKIDGSTGGSKMMKPDQNGQYTKGPPGDPLTPPKGGN